MNRSAWLRSSFGLAILAILLFFNLLLLVANEASITKILAQLPQPIATLIAGIVGLGAIAWQTRRGFENLIASQEHRANLEREARLHQAQLADDQAAKQTHRERQVLAAAIHAELLALLPQVHNAIQSLRIQKGLIEVVHRTNKDYKMTLRIPRFNTDVFIDNLPKIGMLGPSIAGDVITIYTLLRLHLDPSTAEESTVSLLLPLAEGLIETYKNFGGEIVHVSARLAHLQFGRPDPGSLFDFRKSLEAEKTSSD